MTRQRPFSESRVVSYFCLTVRNIKIVQALLLMEALVVYTGPKRSKRKPTMLPQGPRAFYRQHSFRAKTASAPFHPISKHFTYLSVPVRPRPRLA